MLRTEQEIRDKIKDIKSSKKDLMVCRIFLRCELDNQIELLEWVLKKEN
ncbi:hypothetical protein LCGC14_2067210 [marine sediment metagenome]|uniref:Uncharacterized protein n=1 Tax=marine sediment metagenome TaxID=412755 RepID=A0A0F9F6T5_9ZZZZ